MVSGYIVPTFIKALPELCQPMPGYRERLNVGSSYHLNFCSLRCGRQYHAVINNKLFRHAYLRRLTQFPRVYQHSGYCACRSCLRTYQINFGRLCTASSLKVSVEVLKETASVAGACPIPIHGPQALSSILAPAATMSASAPFWQALSAPVLNPVQ